METGVNSHEISFSYVGKLLSLQALTRRVHSGISGVDSLGGYSVATSCSQDAPLRFGPFELEVRSGELRKAGRLVRLRPQASRVLAVLASQGGQLITREELQERVWGSDTLVDMEHGLNLCIREIRAALNDDAESPRYIQTLPKRGYRFVAHVEAIAPAVADVVPPVERPTTVEGPTTVETPPSSTVWRLTPRLLAIIAVALPLLVLTIVDPGDWRDRIAAYFSPRIRSIAVLPLENLSGDPKQEYFADGMTDALTTELGRMGTRVGALKVISRTSVMQYKGIRKPLRQIAKELNVDSIVEGSVQRSGGRVGINVQLIDARTDQHLWARAYERDLGDISLLQREVAQAIGFEIRVQLTPEEQVRLASARPVNPAAHEAYLQGRFHLERWSVDGVKKAIEYFDEAIRDDPNNAPAYAGLAETYVWASGDPLFLEGAIPKAKAAATKALDIDDTLAEARTALAMIKLYNDWDFSVAEREFRRAIEVNPSYAPAHHWYSHCLMATGRFREAMAESRAFLDLDPLSPAANLHLAWTYLTDRQSKQAVEQFQKTLRMEPNYIEAHHGLAQAYLQLGRNTEAIAEMQTAAALSGGGVLYLGTLGQAYARAGRKGEAEKVLSELLERAKRSDVSPYSIAVVYAALDEKDQAFQWLDKALEERSKVLIELRDSLQFENLRSDPRFANILHRVGLPQ
jgi:TolB-like protein/DNA-binding winged helix-turn-helix (wHTH) protein/Tfp pilus assembly protein PilF